MGTVELLAVEGGWREAKRVSECVCVCLWVRVHTPCEGVPVCTLAHAIQHLVRRAQCVIKHTKSCNRL